MSEACQSQNLCFGIDINARRGKLVSIHAGEHGDSEKEQIPSLLQGGFCGRLHHHGSSGSVQSRHRHPETGCRSDRMCDGIWDVVEFEIQKYRAPTALDGLHDTGAFGSEELKPDLAKGRSLAQRIEQAQCSIRIGNIKGDDDFVLGSGGEFHTMER